MGMHLVGLRRLGDTDALQSRCIELQLRWVRKCCKLVDKGINCIHCLIFSIKSVFVQPLLGELKMKFTFHIRLKTRALELVQRVLARYHEFNYESQAKYAAQLGMYASTYLSNDQKPQVSLNPRLY